jgi:prepilin-type processing-associated H-X9-DG protein
MTPFMEQGSLYELYTSSIAKTYTGGSATGTDARSPGYIFPPWHNNYTSPNYNACNPDYRNLCSAQFDTMKCPSDANAKFFFGVLGALSTDVTDASLAKNSMRNYVYNRGDWIGNSANLGGWNSGDNNEVFRNNNVRGPFASGIWFGLESCSDGTSSTLSFSEAAVTPKALSPTIRGGTVQFATAANVLTPKNCLDTKDGKYLKVSTGITIGNPEYGMLFDGRRLAGFTTVLPPNNPSCAPSADFHYSFGINTPNSYHSGGVNAALMDGSVRFVSETVDAGNPSDIQPTAGGPSVYGVWGAMGSKNGGESKGL